MSSSIKDGLNYILQAINNMIEPKLEKLRYDKTYRAKITKKIDAGVYNVQINGTEYKLSYNGDLKEGDIVKVKAPLNNFSDIYVESLPGSGGSSTTTDYNNLTNKPILNTNNGTAQDVNSSEILKGTIKLHKISKTGNYNDLNNKPSLNFIPTSEKGAANGVPKLDSDSKIPPVNLPIASKTSLGCFKLGQNLIITEDGTLSAIGGGTGIVIVDNLNSTSASDALSANQGRILNGKFSSYLPLTGGTLTGGVHVQKSSDDTYFYAKRTDTGTEIGMGVGSGGINHGLYSLTLKKWMIYGDASNVYLNGTADKVKIGARNTTDTWMPVITSGSLQYTTRVMANSKTSTNFNTEQDRIPTLSFLSYWNGAYNSTNASNLTYAHQGIIQCKPKSLYDNNSGTTGTVTLSESVANFSYLEIAYTKNGQIYSTGKIPSPNQKKIHLQIGQWFGSVNSVQMGYEACIVSGTSITRGTYYFMNTSTGGGVSAGNGTNDIAIIKVTGYR